MQALSNDRVFVHTDGKLCKIVVNGTFTLSTSAGEFDLGTIDSAYKPADNYSTNFQRNTVNYFPVYIAKNNTVVHLYKNTTSSANTNSFCTLLYPLKTPLY